MVAAGLAGTSPHMISATITAISRLLFEFKDAIPAQMIHDLIATLVVFVSSNNREIVKSSLGFVKVIVVTLSSGDVHPHLPALVPALLGWSHDHKNHFKGKVRHIFERLIRKFGYPDIVKQAEGVEGDGVKFLENIRKRKERSKRKKAAKNDDGPAGGAMDDGDDDEPSKPKTTAGNAFEDALYGSESEISDSDDEMGGAQRGDQKGAKGKGKAARAADTFIREDGDEPMDLLDRTLAGRVGSESLSASSIPSILPHQLTHNPSPPLLSLASAQSSTRTLRLVVVNLDRRLPSSRPTLTLAECSSTTTRTTRPPVGTVPRWRRTLPDGRTRTS